MLHAMLLICSLSVPSADCDEVRATHYERVPGGHELPFNCLKQAQVWAAEHDVTAPPGAYLKVRCSRHEFGGRVG